MPITLNGTTGQVFPTWTTAGRPASPTASQTGFNSTLGQLEQWNGSAWTAVGVDSSGNFSVPGVLSMPSGFFRNRLINPLMAIDQRNAGAAQTITAGAALAYTVDRWYAYCTGANVTGQRVTGAVANTYYYRFTGAASVTAIGFAQRIEALNSADLAGQTASLSVDLANSLLTTVTWTAYYANTADTFGTLASPTRTQIATGTFTVSSTVTRYSTSISVPAAATTGIEIVFTVGAQTSGTWTIGNVQFEAGGVTGIERRSYGQELALCQRYYETMVSISGAGYATGGGQTYTIYGFYKATKRVAPTIGITFALSNCSASTTSNVDQFLVNPTSAAAGVYAWGSTGGAVTLSAEL